MMKKRLEEYFKPYTNHNIMIAFSGGVDSSLILKAACNAMAVEKEGKSDKQKNNVYAVTISTTLHPMGEVDLCKKIAEEIGAIHKVVAIDELKEAGVIHNPVDRCYRCKKYLFSQVEGLADTLNCPKIFEGTNEDDLGVYRPGIMAVQELEILSPLADLHMTKADVRKLAADYGLSVATRPSSPCLATRFPYGTTLTMDNMKMVDLGEKYISSLGFTNVRVRMYQEADTKTARIEIDIKEMPLAMEHRQELIDKLHTIGFDYITLDLEGFRSGSMDIKIEQ